MSEPSDQPLRDALRQRIADLGAPDAVIVGYSCVVEVVTPDERDPWLKTLGDRETTTWAAVGRARALLMMHEQSLAAGWDDQDDG